MSTDSDVEMQEAKESNRSRMRFWVYWIMSVVTTLMFLLFMTTMFMVPGILPTTKIWMLSVSGVAAVLSLGVWQFESTEAPITAGPSGTIMAVVLVLGFAECTISLFELVTRTHH
jgi:hypothetical protein